MIHMSRQTPRVGLLLILVLCLWLAACEKDAPTLIVEGTKALVTKQYDKAQQSYEGALKLDPNNFDANMGLAEVHSAKREFAKAREYFDKAKGLEAEEAKKQYLTQRYQEMLLEETKGTDAASADYEKNLLALVEMNKRSPAAEEGYKMLADYYMERGDTLSKDKATREQAVELYLKLKGIKVEPARRKQALDKVEVLRRQLYTDAFAKRIEAVKGDLVGKGEFDEANKRIKANIVFEDAAFKPKKDEEKAAKLDELRKAAKERLLTWTLMFADVQPGSAEAKAWSFQPGTFKEEVATVEVGKAQVVVSAEIFDLEQITYDNLIKPTFDKKAPAPDAPAEKPADGGGAAPDAGGAAPADAGGAPPDAGK